MATNTTISSSRTHRVTGTIDRWFDDRGFGFAVDADGNEAFLHINRFRQLLGRRPSTHDVVSYSVGHDTQNRRFALDVELVREASTEVTQEQ